MSVVAGRSVGVERRGRVAFTYARPADGGVGDDDGGGGDG